VLICCERKNCWLIAAGWFVVGEKYCWLVADKPNEQGNAWAMDVKLVGVQIEYDVVHL
jgi:hypothetical protein